MNRLHELVRQWTSGTISLDVARRMASTTDVGASFTTAEVLALCDELRALVHRGEHAITPDVAELLLRAVRARASDSEHQVENAAMHRVAALTYVHVVTASLGTHPDWRRYELARTTGDAVIAQSSTPEEDGGPGHPHLELAGLHLHPLLANVSDGSTWQASLSAWYHRGERASAGHGLRYPEPLDAFELARTHYATCAALASGRQRGLARNGEVSAMEWLGRVRGTGLPQDALTAASEALRLLDPALDASEMTYLLALRQAHGQQLDTEALLGLVGIPVPTLMESIGPKNAVNVRINLAHLVQPIDSTLALALVENAAPAVEAAGDASVLARHSDALLSALFEHMSEGVSAPDGPLVSGAQQVVAHAEQAGWSPVRTAGVLLKLVARAGNTDEEAEALQIYDIAHTLAADPFNAYPAAFQFLRMSLFAGMAVNAARQEDWDTAVQGYGAALKLALPIGFLDFAGVQLMNLVNASGRGGAPVLQRTLGILFEQGLALQHRLGSEGVERVQALAVQLTAQQVASGDINTELLHLTWRLAKARRFGGAWRTHAARALVEDAAIDARRALLDQIEARSAQVSLDEQASGPGSRIARDRRLLAFVRDTLPAEGVSPGEQLANLQHRFDTLLERQLAAHVLRHEPEYIPLARIRESLDARTVVLELFLGEMDEKRMVVAMLSSAANGAVSAIPDRDGLLKRFSEADRHELAYSYEEDVYLVREVVLASESTAEQIAPYLHAAGGSFLHGSVGAALDRLRDDGCDHLIIVPHGPFHYAPLQLFARERRLLADEWTVTVLPSVELLTAPASEAPVPPRRDGLAAFGLDFASVNPLHLPELDGVVDEATRVAAAFGATPVLNAAATPTAIMSAMRARRYVHLATHGALNLDAPAFQMLVAAHEPGGDGIVQAHELLTLDLRGLELVSLGACETALGRIDRADNPRGLPAALLLAGAQTVVGTLWEVASDTARVFFVTMYTALAGDASRRDAFRAAQVETRRRFPDARDWGAFYLVGAWS